MVIVGRHVNLLHGIAIGRRQLRDCGRCSARQVVGRNRCGTSIRRRRGTRGPVRSVAGHRGYGRTFALGLKGDRKPRSGPMAPCPSGRSSPCF